MKKTTTLNRTMLVTLDEKALILSGLFIAGNVLLPTLAHTIVPWGHVFLPIYFFSLLGGLMFGWRAGVIIGLVSPLVSYGITQMPPLMILQFVIIKSILLGLISGLVVTRWSYYMSALVTVLVTQIIGVAYILLVTHSQPTALFDIKIGYPGLLFQIVLVPVIAVLWKRYADKDARGNPPKSS